MIDNTNITLKSAAGATASMVSTVAYHLYWLDEFVRAVCFYGGAVLTVVSIVSVCIDIRRKLLDRKLAAKRGRRIGKFEDET